MRVRLAFIWTDLSVHLKNRSITLSDNYKFEMIRADDSAQITTCHSIKFKGYVAREVVHSFTEFLQACGFHPNTVLDAYEMVIDEMREV